MILCISMQWFREWESFVKGKDNGTMSSSTFEFPSFSLYQILFLNSFPEPPGPIDNSKIGVMKGGHIQLKQGKSEEVEKDIKVENQCTVFRHCLCFSPQVQTMVRSQRRLGSTCWEFMAEALRLQ